MIEIPVTGSPLATDQQIVSLVRRIVDELKDGQKKSCTVAFAFSKGPRFVFRVTYVPQPEALR
jgi:hypothetical protein